MMDEKYVSWLKKQVSSARRIGTISLEQHYSGLLNEYMIAALNPQPPVVIPTVWPATTLPSNDKFEYSPPYDPNSIPVLPTAGSQK